MDESIAKTPPNSLVAEQSVLGGLLSEGRAWDYIAGMLVPEDFYRHEHKLIFSTMTELAKANQPLDAVTVSEHLESLGSDEASGGLPYVAGLAQDTPGATNIKAWAQIILEHSTRRQLIRVGAGLIESGYEKDGRGSPELIECAEREVYQIAESRQSGEKTYASTGDLTDGVLEDIQRTADGESVGLQVGIKQFDEMTTGLYPGDVLVLAGRPAMGKTSLALNWIEHVSIDQGIPSALFSMEMPAAQLVRRLISSHGRIDQQAMRKGTLDKAQWGRVNSASASVKKAPIYIDDTPALSPNALRARARRMKRKHGIEFLVVDYLQLMQVPNTKENRTNEISEISRSLKALAKELEIPIVALSQLNRSVDQRDNKRPRMSDLRESGGIEQDADLIVFVYREEEYDPDTVDKGIAELGVAKQRNGPTGKVRTAYLSQYTRFENLAPDWRDGYGVGAAA